MAQPRIDDQGHAALEMAPRLAKFNALLDGTEGMREAGRKYLPQYSAETDRSYAVRLQRAVLFNYFARTVQALGGRPFSRKLQLKNADPKIEALYDDIDFQGNNLHVFAQREFETALAKGICMFLVEYPRVNVANAAEERALNPRPYWVSVAPENLIAAYTAVNERGEEYITHARIKSEEIEQVGEWGEQEVERITVYEPDLIRVYREEPRKVANRKVYRLEDTYINVLGYVPLMVFYAKREEAFVAKSILNDLADKNIEHWQSSSDQRHCLTVARFPMLGAKGITAKEADGVKLGPTELLASESPTGEFYYIEHTGAALAAGREDLNDLKAEMATLALEAIAPRDRATATEINQDATPGSSLLMRLALSFEDLLERALEVSGDWLKLPPEKCGEVALNTNFDLTGLDAKAMDALIAARNKGDIDALTFLSELVRRGILSADLDIPAVIAQGMKEADAAAEKAAELAAKSKPATVSTKPSQPGAGSTGGKPTE